MTPLVWAPKYRFRLLTGNVAQEEEHCIRWFSNQRDCQIVELNIQTDHVHLLVMIPPMLSISDYVGIVKVRTAIRVLNNFKKIKQKPYCGNHFWARGYCVDTSRRQIISQEEL